LMDVVSHFNEGIKLYRAANWSKAISQFEEAIKFNPNDNLSKTYIERCNHLSSNPPKEEWNGVWIMTSK